jgi:hypothetical protein
MTDPTELVVKCEDFLKDSHCLYAHKARRKKIALLAVEATNKLGGDARLLLKDSKLVVGDRTYAVEAPPVIIRKLSEFTWDFVVYAILVFEPLLIVVDVFFFLTGPLYNRRLKRQLAGLSDGELPLKAGESKKCLAGFRGVPKGAVGQLHLRWLFANGEGRQLQCRVGLS